MTALFATDSARARAAALRVLLARLDAGDGNDLRLTDELLEALDAPVLIGDPVADIESAIDLARWLEQDTIDTVASTLRALAGRVRAGWKRGCEVTRATCATVVKVHLAKLEGGVS